MDITIKKKINSEPSNNFHVAQQNYKTTCKMRGSHINVPEHSSVLGCDSVCLVSSSEEGCCHHL